MPEVENRTLLDNESLVDVDTPHIHSVSSDFPDQSIQTDTQAARLDREVEAALAANRKNQSRSHRTSQAVKSSVNDPVTLVSALSTFTLATAFGFGAYRQSQKPGGFGGWVGVLGWVAGAGVAGAATFFGNKLFADKYRGRN